MMHRPLLTALIALVWSPFALAAELAVLDLDGYGLRYDGVLTASQSLRDAALEDGRFYPIDPYEISDRLAAGHEEDLTEARRLVAEGRKALELGNASYALRQLTEGINLHLSVGSPFCRRPEMADAHYFAGVAMLQVGRATEANANFVQAEYFYSGYLGGRAPSPSSYVSSTYERATAGMLEADHALPSTDTLAALEEVLHVDGIIVGWMDVNGKLYGRMIQDGEMIGEVTRQANSAPPPPGDPIYGEVLRELLTHSKVAGRTRTTASSTITSTAIPGSSSSTAAAAEPEFADLPTFDEPVDLDEDPYAEEDVSEPEPQEEDKKKEKKSRLSKNKVGKIKSSGRIRYQNEPITHKWWFWTATGAVVVGGGTAVAVVTLQDSSEDDGGSSSTDPGEPGYTVSIETGE